MASEYKLHIGSYGWLHESWDNSFYPEDLPREWQFAYYANEYSVLMIPWILLQENFELFGQGIADSEETCRLIFELPLNNINSRSNDEILTEVQQFLKKISFVGFRSLALVLVFKYSDICNLSSEKLDFINILLKISQAQINICIDIQEIKTSGLLEELLPKQFIAILKQEKVGLCGLNDATLNSLKDDSSKLHITFCEISNNDPKQMRKIVENSLVGECEGSTNVLIFRSENPNHALMKTASVISDLL
ncbi:MAG: hypothetical protein ACC657_00035 [Thiohalomonadales bacterium]